jgi:hypothetical protein
VFNQLIESDAELLLSGRFVGQLVEIVEDKQGDGRPADFAAAA